MATTIDNKEIEHFNKAALQTQANSWWKEYQMLLEMNEIRIPFIINGIRGSGIKIPREKPLSGLSILDVGCGAGFLTEALAKLGAHVTGLDAANDLLKLAKAHVNDDTEIKNNIDYVCETIEEFAEQNKECYDVVVASEIIEHVNAQELFVKSCVEVLKPGGSIFLTTINKTWTSWMKAIVIYEKIFGVIPKGTHEWVKFITPENVSKMLRTCKCDTKLVKGSTYDPLRRKWTWCSSTSVFYALHAVRDN